MAPKKTYQELVVEAIKAMGQRGGSSIQVRDCFELCATLLFCFFVARIIARLGELVTTQRSDIADEALMYY